VVAVVYVPFVLIVFPFYDTHHKGYSADAESLYPVLKHGPRSLTYVRVLKLEPLMRN
jgi:hypothetical protein